MGFIERIFHPVIKAVERALTPQGTGGQEAAAQQAAAVQAAKPTPNLPSVPAAPPSPPTFAAGQSPQGKMKTAASTATTLLGQAAVGSGAGGITGQKATKSLIGQ